MVAGHPQRIPRRLLLSPVRRLLPGLPDLRHQVTGNRKISTFFFVVSEIMFIFASESITNDLQYMATTIIRKPASFRLRADLLEGLKRNAARENRTLNNYVESVLLDIVYHEPNSETKVALKEAMSRKNYPAEELYTDVDEMIKALDAEV